VEATKTKFKTVDDYLSVIPSTTEVKLQQLRKAIKTIAPKAEEVISYNMPAFKLNGMLVWYAAYKNHIGFYPMASAIKVFKDDLAGYKTSKGAIQFPIEKAIPATLVKNIVRFRINENNEKAAAKGKKTK